MEKRSDYRLLDNSRFYILVFSFLLSIVVLAGWRLRIPGDQLFHIRTQQTFGFLALLYWYVALTISPIGYVIGKQRTKHLEFARRAIGVSAFYFASLHGTVALWGQLGGPTQLGYLPSLFKWSLLGGAVAMCILLAMAATSLDRVVAFMTYRRWKWLHRLGYIGGTLAVLHVWTIGTHLAYPRIRMIGFLALFVLVGLELYRVVKLLNDKRLHLGRLEAVTLYLSLWTAVTVAVLALPALVQNYHGRHTGHGNHQGVGL